MTKHHYPNPRELLNISCIETKLIGFYDVNDIRPFDPFTESDRCFFACYEDWQKGYSTIISTGNASCQGGGYWIGGVTPKWAEKPDGKLSSIKNFAHKLNSREGFKSSDELMCKFFDNLDPYIIKNKYAVIAPFKQAQYEYLKTITFYVTPDQLSLLILGAEYNNASLKDNPVITTFGSGCGQMAAVLDNLGNQEPKAVIGATDIAMRQHLPPELLAFTVNKPMFKQLCELDQKSFLGKPFWERLRKDRNLKNMT